MTAPDLLAVIVRFGGFVALFQAAGAAFFLLLFGVRLGSGVADIRRLAARSAWIALMLVILHLVLEPARLTGEFGGLLDSSMRRLAWTSNDALAQSLRIAGLLLVAVAMWRRSPSVGVASFGAVCAIATFLLSGHTTVHPLRAVLAPLLALHLLAIAFWFGALLPLRTVLRQESPPIAAAVVEAFSAVAIWLVPIIAVVGLILVFVLADGFPGLDTGYGVSIVAKLVGFVVLLMLAAWNRFRLTPGIAGDSGESRLLLQRSIAVEFVLIVCVLAVTAGMTSFFSPGE